MADSVTLTCPCCGGKLQVTNDIGRFACAHCGGEHIVQRSGGAVALAPAAAGLRQVEAGVDRVVAELALARLQTDVQKSRSEVNSLTTKRQELRGRVCLQLVLGVALLLWGIFSSAWLMIGAGAFCILVGLYALAVLTTTGQSIAQAQSVLQGKLRELSQTEGILKGK